MAPPAARLAFRSTRRAAIVWGLVFGSTVLGSVRGFVAAYPAVADREHLAHTLGTNAGVRALLGVPHHIDTVGGFTAWRSLGVLTIVGAVWGLLASTRLLRGEEDAGRWELVLAGATTRQVATAHVLSGLALGLALAELITAGVSLGGGEGLSAGSYLFLTLAIISVPALFAAVGALASQLAGARRQAATIAGALFGFWFLLRLIADSGSGTGWLRWTTPLGWVEELRPMAGARPLVLLPIAALIAALTAASVVIAGWRDEGAGLLPSHESARARPRLLTGPLGLTARLTRGTAAAWTVGLGMAAFVFGIVAKAAAEATTSQGAAEIFSRLGARRLGAEAYLGATFLMLGAVVALAAAGQVAAGREEEASGRLDHLVVRPVARARWIVARAAIGLAEVCALGVVVGAAAWIGTATQGTGLAFGRMVGAGLNLIPAGVFVLGLGLLLLGVAPRLVAAGVYGVVGWSFVVELVASLVQAPSWFLDLSLFHHVALAPAVDPNLTSGAVLVLLGLAGGGAGALAFARRDLVPN